MRCILIIQSSSQADTIIFFFFFFWPCHRACRILVPRPGIKPRLPAMEVQNLNLCHQGSPADTIVFITKWESCVQLRQCCFRALNHYVTKPLIWIPQWSEESFMVFARSGHPQFLIANSGSDSPVKRAKISAPLPTENIDHYRKYR